MKAATKAASSMMTWLFYADLGSAQSPANFRVPGDAVKVTFVVISYYITSGYQSKPL